MLLTGQSSQYHNWEISSPILARILEDAGLFDVDRVVSPPRGGDLSSFNPAFADYDVVVMDYEGDDWPEATQRAFEDYMRSGGGLVTFHATDNAFPHWAAFNEMIGIGGWGLKPDGSVGERDMSDGVKVRWRDGHTVLDDSPGGYNHPPKHDFSIETRASDHPIMRGLPDRWMHPNDEIYSQLRGPAQNLEVLATAYADRGRFENASGEHEPMLMTIRYGEGRIFHTTLGHVGRHESEPIAALNDVGFITTLQRGTEWAATGRVTQPVPDDFPAADAVSLRE